MLGSKAPVVIFPHLHRKILRTLGNSINPKPSFLKGKQRSIDDYPTFIMGIFTCENGKCSQRGWESKKICTVIRKYPNNGYNAQVFNQACVSCGELGRMHINVDSYIERVAYRLKKWAGIAVDRPPRAGSLDRSPHKSGLCEGCKRKICQAGDWE
ncbi:zinc-binding domain-containing protein [Lasiosphaeris hirsuta]|uniref:Zinc-binding domain-containing protein n=1 Tax=Lasiosphaeris hirsuta TaxID=260670 RepID=A0AA40B8G3_9PEZI|nr:zinc-binding domain-containing protein [Lasiosphaeris hirsuta]